MGTSPLLMENNDDGNLSVFLFIMLIYADIGLSFFFFVNVDVWAVGFSTAAEGRISTA